MCEYDVRKEKEKERKDGKMQKKINETKKLKSDGKKVTQTQQGRT